MMSGDIRATTLVELAYESGVRRTDGWIGPGIWCKLTVRLMTLTRGLIVMLETGRNILEQREMGKVSKQR